MIISIALGAAQGVALLDAMAKDMASYDRITGTLAIHRAGEAPAKATFILAKPNRFLVKGGGADIRFDGTVRYAMKDGKWVPIGKNGDLPGILRGFEGFYGRKLKALKLGEKSTNIPGDAFVIAKNLTLYVNKNTKRPVGRAFAGASGKTDWVYIKDMKSTKTVVAAKTSKPNPIEDPKPVRGGVVIGGPVSGPSTTLVQLKTEPYERPNLPIQADSAVPAGATASTGAATIAATPAELAAKLPKAGDMAKSFVAPLATGATVDFDKILKKSSGVILVFWHTNCPASATYIPFLETMRPEMGQAKVFLLGIDNGDSAGEVKQFLKDKSSGMLSAISTDAAALYGVQAFPTTIAIGADGKVVASFVGADEAAFKTAFEALKPKK